MRSVIAALCLATSLTSPAFADAVRAPSTIQQQPARALRAGSLDNNVSAFGLLGFSYGSGMGFGVRYQKTLMPQGVLNLPNLKDDLGLEAGLDFMHYGSGWAGVSVNEYAPVVGGVWNFWINDKLALYPKLDLAYAITTVSADNGWGGSVGGFFVQGAAGVSFQLDKLNLRGEVGTNRLRLGLGLTF